MQATSSFRGSGLSRGLGVIVAVGAAFVIGAGGGYAARSLNAAASATSAHPGTVSLLHQQAPDAASRNAQVGLRNGGPGGQVGDLTFGDPNALVSAPTRAVVPAQVDPSKWYQWPVRFGAPAANPTAGYDMSEFDSSSAPLATSSQSGSSTGADGCILTRNHHKAC